MICPICNQDNGPLVYQFHPIQDEPLLQHLKKEKGGQWNTNNGACRRCIDQAQLSQWETTANDQSPFQAEEASDYWILPIPQRLTAHPSYTGKGVSICFIDSGFYLHPDLCEPEPRILKMLDIHHPDKDVTEEWAQPHPHSWHGTMTSVVGAGNGTCSNGVYRSLAPDANLVLIKVMDEHGRINGDAITAALNWVEANHEKWGIRIINLSVSDDWEVSYQESEVDLAIERLVNKGINVVAAAGNDSNATLKAPANSPHAITVGGVDDHNTLHPLTHSLYHSTFGQTIDQTYKPEVIAPAIWLPAPILPGTKEHQEALALFKIKNSPDQYRKAVAANLIGQTALSTALLTAPLADLDRALAERLVQTKFINPHYQHSDGTSFAAPIVCSLIAQMLEANPELTPGDVREILLSTARKLEGLPTERQGFGVVHPLSAVHHSEKAHQHFAPYFSPVIDYKNKQIKFHHHDVEASRVATSGSFNDWQEPDITMETTEEHQWEGEVALFKAGKYAYKYVVDGLKWQNDLRNLFREPDGLGGFNSLVIIEKMTQSDVNEK